MSEATPEDRTDDPPTCYCPLTGVVETLSGKYAMQLVCVVGALEPVRFGTIEEYLEGASTSTLSARLDELADEGIVARTQYDEIPPRVEYELTDDGRELQERLEPVLEWAEERERERESGD
ncbi:helix-turn-helix transcriptional regulator [Halostella sp. JP-L12]|uniref:winged helix-turn-helix transcriptional regulator n=1 Tax=Halostella TaxID=1843185 RepID=UPI000EF8525C|nr:MULTISPECIES: helix-turn-helix domain-containing protein [Halostella]NHN46073.1 helix-turn-helix transcriptional regulator [Halostella sp. JP-L12]